MKDLVDQMIRQVTHREPTEEARDQIGKMVASLPREVAEDPTTIYDLVVRHTVQRETREYAARIADTVHRRFEEDFRELVRRQIREVVREVREKLPADARDQLARMARLMIAWTLTIAVVVGFIGWAAGAASMRRDHAAHHASGDREFARCVDAATGRFVTSARRGSRELPNNDTVRNDLMVCGAEYADRRAGDR